MNMNLVKMAIPTHVRNMLQKRLQRFPKLSNQAALTHRISPTITSVLKSDRSGFANKETSGTPVVLALKIPRSCANNFGISQV